MKMLSGLVLFAFGMGLVRAGDPAWNAAMNAVQVECAATNDIDQAVVPFVGFKDECDNEQMVVYEPPDSRLHWDLVIDPRNAIAIQWDTARYKRYGTYYPTTNLTWHVPAGFNNLWARVYYANDNDVKFGGMVYQVSSDGVTYTTIPNLNTGLNMECTIPPTTPGGPNGCWYKKKEETATLDRQYFYLKAIWPAPCAGEIGKTYRAEDRSCLSLPPPGYQGTLEQFDADPIKDLYYTPQLGEIILGASANTPGRPTNLRLTAGDKSIKVEWDAPTGEVDKILGYTVYYQTESSQFAADATYKPPYLAKHQNVGHVGGVILANLDPTRLYIVRVAAINQHGSGPSTSNVWTHPVNDASKTLTCPASIGLPPATTASPPASTHKAPSDADSSLAASTTTLKLAAVSVVAGIVLFFAL